MFERLAATEVPRQICVLRCIWKFLGLGCVKPLHVEQRLMYIAIRRARTSAVGTLRTFEVSSPSFLSAPTGRFYFLKKPPDPLSLTSSTG